MKTEAHCPTCNHPFSFWRVAFLYDPFHFYCRNCSWRIVIGNDKIFLWGALAAVAGISFMLLQFIIARDMWRLLIIAVLWLVSFQIIAIITGLVIVNVARFYKPEPDENERESDAD
ncbi:MAG TPA: hypothetical protein VJ784_17865 [Pyrinomonadaceae bacterium]|nr:hypothetical protein [Pyrinomonadaceae bacterium]